MNFPSIWISYIKTCLNSTSFSLLINGVPINWVQPSYGIRQGDPLSSFLFIFLAQNLTVILNFARQLDLIFSISRYLRYNFIQLMYADDLILITTASRRSTRDIKFYLNLYAKLASQIPNQCKSEAYFPSWINRRVSSRICDILNLKQRKILFKYLRVLISNKQLAAHHFNNMINNLNLVVANWGKANFSKAGKAILINSVIMATPIYYLSVYPI